jgi:hypothetical protein
MVSLIFLQKRVLAIITVYQSQIPLAALASSESCLTMPACSLRLPFQEVGGHYLHHLKTQKTYSKPACAVLASSVS